MTELAREYGVSDVALGKICARLRVPRPGVGHWAKIRAGKKVRRKPLPKLKKGEPDSYRITGVERYTHPPGETASLPRIEVPGELTDPHPLVSRAKKSLQKAPKDEAKRLVPRTNRCLDVRVTPATLERALLLMNAIATECEKRGWKLDIEPRVVTHPAWHRREDHKEEVRETRVLIEDQAIEVALLEVMKPIAIEPELRNGYRWGGTTYRYEPTGRLRIEIGTAPGAHGLQRTWGDGKKQRLERVLHRVVAGLARCAEARREQEARRRAWEVERREEERRAEENRRRRELLRALDDDAVQRIDMLARSDQLARLASRIEERLSSEQLAASHDWIGWLRQRSADYEHVALEEIPPAAWSASREHPRG